MDRNCLMYLISSVVFRSRLSVSDQPKSEPGVVDKIESQRENNMKEKIHPPHSIPKKNIQFSSPKYQIILIYVDKVS